MFDYVLDGFALRGDWPNQVVDHLEMLRMIGVGPESRLIEEIGDETKIRVAVLQAEVAAEAIGLDAGNLRRQLAEGGLQS